MAMFGKLGKSLGLGHTPGIVKSLAPVAGAVVGNMLLPGLGAGILGSGVLGSALGAGVGRAATGGKLKDDLLAAGMAGAGAATMNYLSPATGSVSLSGSGGGGALPSSTVGASGSAGGSAWDAAGGSLNLPSSSLPVSESLGGAVSSATPTASAALPDTILGSNALGGMAKDAAAAKNLLGGHLGDVAKIATPLVMNSLSGQGASKAEKALLSQAQQQQAAGQELLSTLRSGKLPAGLQSAYDQMLQNQQSQIRSQFASMGLSGSTMEQQALQQAASSIQADITKQVESMVSQGSAMVGASTNAYNTILDYNMKNDQALSSAMSSAIAALLNPQDAAVKNG